MHQTVVLKAIILNISTMISVQYNLLITVNYHTIHQTLVLKALILNINILICVLYNWLTAVNYHTIHQTLILKAVILNFNIPGLPTAGLYLGSAWPLLENCKESSWDSTGSYYSHVAKSRLKIAPWTFTLHTRLRVTERDRQRQGDRLSCPPKKYVLSGNHVSIGQFSVAMCIFRWHRKK